MPSYRDLYYTSADGLRLYARDYPAARTDALTILCLHGLTRNSADFTDLCDLLSPTYRILVAEQRGRGDSQWDTEIQHYQPLTYVQDMWTLLDTADVHNVVIVGTSMGGLMGMIMASQYPSRVQGMIINDVGPEVDPRGLSRLMQYVGRENAINNWQEAIEYTRQINAVCFPDYDDIQWQQMARRLFREDANGRPVLAYDPAIATAIHQSAENAVPPDLWPLYQSLINTPLLLIRGALSDLLSESCFQRMQQATPDALAVEVPRVGHAPMLSEPEAINAITHFLETRI